jgi:DNA-binding response OmpR family regulator
MMAARPDPGSANHTVQTILVVEDEVLIRIQLAENLRDSGYRVIEAATVAEAKAVLNADASIGLVFTDINMPGEEDGFVLTHWVRQHHRNVRILLTSGAPHASARRSFADCPTIVAKPYYFDAILLEVRALLGQPRGAAPA